MQAAEIALNIRPAAADTTQAMSLPLPRPILIALLGLLLVMGGLVTVHNLTKSSEPSTSSQVAAPRLAPPSTLGHKPAPHKAAPAKPAAKPQPKAPAPKGARPAGAGQVAGIPTAVADALAHHRVTVLFFSQAGADDDAAREAVSALRSKARWAAVFSEDIGRLDAYQSVVGNLGVSRAPAIIVVNRESSARVLEGYVDAGTLLQYAEDARR
jgi:hypothetical protein